MSQAPSPVLVHVEDQVGEISLNLPPVNAFTSELYEGFITAVEELAQRDDVNVILLRAEGRLFSAGADLKQMQSDTTRGAAVRRRLLRKALEVFAAVEVPTVVAVHGATVGIGAMIAAEADFWVASEDTYLLLPEIKAGVIGGYSHFAELLPRGVVRRLVLTAEPLSVEDMYRFGLVTEIFAADELEAGARAVCKTIASFGRESGYGWKSAFRSISTQSAYRNLMIEQNFSKELAALRQ